MERDTDGASMLKELRTHIDKTGFKSPVANTAISTYIGSHILEHPNNLFHARVPPLDIILYAFDATTKQLDSPEHRVEVIPDMVDLLTTIEFYRIIALEKAKEALASYEGELTRQEKDSLGAHAAQDALLRGLYLELYRYLAGYHMYHLWTSDPPRPTDVVARLHEYYPEIFTPGNYSTNRTPTRQPHESDRRLFHNDLTAAERKECWRGAIEVCKFMDNTFIWCEQNYPGIRKVDVFQKPDFREANPCSFSLEEIKISLEYYRATVQDMVFKLQDMFPPEDGQVSPTKDKGKAKS
ncbi:hypothetical protein HMN09_01304300 [Mycena chlorophos]|uniref:Uncharacterized protein n=1 Tax=Mycena chlorophos TaxID=658473 RepID=A0A8H6VS45_MYCCL|nr:hypothetical protein HMN09_01304300 [Mycena chlorophos]